MSGPLAFAAVWVIGLAAGSVLVAVVSGAQLGWLLAAVPAAALLWLLIARGSKRSSPPPSARIQLPEQGDVERRP